MLVAEGRIEAASDTLLSPWDIAAPRLIVEEAGGRWTEDPGLWLASNGLLHDEVSLADRRPGWMQQRSFQPESDVSPCGRARRRSR